MPMLRTTRIFYRVSQFDLITLLVNYNTILEEMAYHPTLVQFKLQQKSYVQIVIVSLYLVSFSVFHIVSCENRTNLQCVHGDCINGTGCVFPESVQGEVPCTNLTHGLSSKRCSAGYYWNFDDGGKCVACECNDQGTCDPDTGKCSCKTKGTIGKRCELCDNRNNYYHGDPSNNEPCTYELITNYQFTFNLSKKEDKQFTRINFKNSPTRADLDVVFSVNCSEVAKVNLTVETEESGKIPILIGQNCSSVRSTFLKSEYNFGTEEKKALTTFYVSVYDIRPPLLIRVFFAQYPN